jgi:nucleoside-diphosphate-sugar epimerase
MAKVVIIGGSGHVGTYLVPRLVEAGHHVINVTRGHRKPYTPNAAWGRVETVLIDREAAEHEAVSALRLRRLRLTSSST